MKLFCLIPSYNESGNLKELCLRLNSVLKRKKIDYKILFILQGDVKSIEILKIIQKSYPQIGFQYFPNALGIGKAYRTGFLKVPKKWTHVLTLDADLNHQPEELEKFFHALQKTNADIVIGSRFIKGGNFYDKRWWKRIGSQFVNQVINILLGITIKDKTSGYRLIKKEVIANIGLKVKEKGYPFYMEFILLAQKSRYSIVEVPINYVPRQWGKSKMGKIKTLIDYLAFFCKLLINS